MAHALRLARRGEYSTAPNPSVGCVVLDAAGTVVGEGWHRRAGEPHAEIHALAAAAGRARGGTAYVTLEPCAHQGRTPPCVDAVLEAAPARVVIAMQDPNPRVAGAGLRRLEAAGIAVTVGVLEREAGELNRGFVSRMTRGRPWVTVKVGASIDGRTALASGESKWITGATARTDVQRLACTRLGDPDGHRHGARRRPGTDRARPATADLWPPTAARGVRYERQDPATRTPAAGWSPDADLYLRRSGRGDASRTCGFARRRVEPLPLQGDRLDLHAALRRLAELECNEVLVEAGPILAGAFVAGGCVDEIVIYLGGDAARRHEPSDVRPARAVTHTRRAPGVLISRCAAGRRRPSRRTAAQGTSH